MPASPEQLAEARKKAVMSPLIGKRGKSKTTIAKEERRAIFDEIVSEEFPELIKLARPEYKLDQFLGKAEDKLKIEVKEDNEEIKELSNKFDEFLKNNS